MHYTNNMAGRYNKGVRLLYLKEVKKIDFIDGLINYVLIVIRLNLLVKQLNPKSSLT